MGLVSYIGRFIPDLATKTFPLRELTKAGQDYQWQAQHEEAFHRLKESVAAVTTLAYFKPGSRTRLIADASTVGLGAVLVQFQDSSDSSPVVISFASKSLSDTEKRYSQTEKEALALVWGVERFKEYLLGSVFELETDHKPLTEIFKPTSKPTPRLERWVLRLQAFKFQVVYRKGKENIADPFSRLLPLTEREVKDFDSDVDEKAFINAVVESAAIDVTTIREEIESDQELRLVREALMSDN